MPARFQKSDRLLHQADFDRVHGSDYVAADEVLVIKAARNSTGKTRLGLSVSRRVGKAVTRNRWKRLIREAFRGQAGQLPAGWDLVVRPRRGARPDARAIARSLPALMRRIDKYARRRNPPGRRGAVAGPQAEPQSGRPASGG